MNPSIVIAAASESYHREEGFIEPLPRPRLLRRKTAHAVFYREKHKIYNRIC